MRWPLLIFPKVFHRLASRDIRSVIPAYLACKNEVVICIQAAASFPGWRACTAAIASPSAEEKLKGVLEASLSRVHLGNPVSCVFRHPCHKRIPSGPLKNRKIEALSVQHHAINEVDGYVPKRSFSTNNSPLFR